LLVVSPLLVTLRIHPELQERVGQLGGPMDALRAGDLAPVAGSAWDTVRGLVWGGDPRWTYTLPNRPVFEALGAVLFLTGLLVAVWRWRSARFFFVLAWLVVGLVPSMLSPDAPSLNRMVGAMPVVYLFPALVPRWLANRFRGGGKIGFGLLGVWLAITAGWTVRDGFVRWPAATETRWKYQTILLEIARDIQSQPETVPVVVDSWFDPIDESSLRRNLGSDVAVRWAQAGAAVVYPVGGEGRLYVPEFAAMAGSLIETGSVPSSPLYRSAGIPSYAVYALSASPAAPADVTRVAVGDVATFLGFRLLDRQGPTVELITRWRVDAALPADLAIFVHLLAADASIVAQSDGLDVAATTLRPGDEFVQLSLLSLSEPQLACPCLLQVGMYRRGDGSRLAIPGHPDDRIILVRDLCR
jgi:hypothetical protein